MPKAATIDLHAVDREFKAVVRKLKDAQATATPQQQQQLVDLIRRLDALRGATLTNCPRAYGIWPPSEVSLVQAARMRKKAPARPSSRKG
jgi:hypothetical protein